MCENVDIYGHVRRTPFKIKKKLKKKDPSDPELQNTNIYNSTNSNSYTQSLYDSTMSLNSPNERFETKGNEDDSTESIGLIKYKGDQVLDSLVSNKTTNSHLNSTTRTKLTAAEKTFLKIQKQRLQSKIVSRTSMTHRKRVAQFNAKLASLPEHFDMPKVGPG
ncbi:uncharacterized protein CMU_013430 [Cryptosporidium muris RN66]|uniref:Uncharacterized protein n=1 Tax=Cryptosporidium muris (strain RN66) TaxID=441375 RepID=B6AEQ1_CRYMR|nr:uncharacterized protein CMU_013430 [Cryptosporidium muris RN66]EEA06668.1 hypothetical protein CMU_013430 [Cryptosporidium muris RN66]|eukprot:XP_002141017.1 hypothetical protein [Cryptosporidium muris RN66]